MATPLVSGAATLVRQFYQERFDMSFISAALIKATLMNGAADLYPGQFEGKVLEIPTQRPNIHEGWGRVDLENSLFPENRVVRFMDELKGLETGETRELKVEVVDAQQPLKITLVYTDAPGASQSENILVNDLDLEIIGPSKKRYFAGEEGLKGDHVNNVEGVDISDPHPGVYRIRVKGTNVPATVIMEDEEGNQKEGQPFALVVSGGLAE